MSKAKKAAAAEQRAEAAYLEKLVIEYVPIDSIKPNQYNPNRQSDHDFELLRRSIEEDGFTRPIVVRRETREIVDGEHRWRACRSLDYSEIPVVFVNMTDAQARIATLKYNRIHGAEDANLAASVLKEIVEMGAEGWAQDSLMLDDVEMERLKAELAVVEHQAVEADVPATMLGPSGQGLAAVDARGVDTSADETRAKQRLLEQAKGAEERRFEQADAQVFRIVTFFSGPEADVVRRVLGDAPALRLLDLCREFDVSPAGEAPGAPGA